MEDQELPPIFLVSFLILLFPSKPTDSIQYYGLPHLFFLQYYFYLMLQNETPIPTCNLTGIFNPGITYICTFPLVLQRI